MPHLHIPRLALDLDGVDPALARQVAALLPGALERALNPGRAGSTIPPAPGSAQALADQAAGRVAARVRSHLPEHASHPTSMGKS